jgi:hypothetical protein
MAFLIIDYLDSCFRLLRMTGKKAGSARCPFLPLLLG